AVVFTVPVLILFTVDLVVTVAIADQVIERKAVMAGDKIDAGPGATSIVLEDITGAVQTLGEIRQHAAVTAPETANRVPVAVVPLTPAHRKATQLIAAGSDVPRLRDQLDAGHGGILVQRIEEAAAPIKAIGLPAQHRREIEAEAVHLHRAAPVAQTIQHHL